MTCNDTSPQESGQVHFSLDLVPVQALALKVFRHAQYNASTIRILESKLDALLESTRILPGGGRFRTNGVPIELVSPGLSLASDGWKYKDSLGFAVKMENQTGDWHLFNQNSTTPDGNGNYGLQEENGGSLLSTTSFVFESGVYPQIVSDYFSFAANITDILQQLNSYDTSSPLLPSSRAFLRVPITDPLVHQLCVNVRGQAAEIKDAWNQTWCDYYKSVSFDLPEDGLVFFSFVRGLLGLEYQIRAPYNASPFTMTLYGTPVLVSQGHVESSGPCPSATTRVTLPLEAGQRWPVGIKSIVVTGLNVYQLHNVSLTCFVDCENTCLDCCAYVA
jgi:hypothetical protein